MEFGCDLRWEFREKLVLAEGHLAIFGVALGKEDPAAARAPIINRAEPVVKQRAGGVEVTPIKRGRARLLTKAGGLLEPRAGFLGDLGPLDFIQELEGVFYFAAVDVKGFRAAEMAPLLAGVGMSRYPGLDSIVKGCDIFRRFQTVCSWMCRFDAGR